MKFVCRTMRIAPAAAVWVRGMALFVAVFAGAFNLNAAVPLHKDAPEFVRADLQKKRVDLRALRGKVVLLNFWATWCGPCKLEIPQLVAWQNKYGPRGLQVVGVAMDEDSSLVQLAQQKLKLNYPVVMGDGALSNQYGDVSDLPHTFLIDARGKVQADFAGEVDLNDVERKFLPMLPK